MRKNKKGIIGTHWGNYQVETSGDQVIHVKPSSHDTNPSDMGKLLYDMTDSRYRISQPMVRAGYLRGDVDHKQNRGTDSFVPVSWDEAFNLAASALKETIEKHGNAGIYGGSYGWSSAGRFHHAQSQVHRFLNMIGGYTYSVNTYSSAAANVIIPYVIGYDYHLANELVKYDDISECCDLLVAFGGLNEYNNQVAPGGISDHRERKYFKQLVAAGVEIISISPIKSDTPDYVEAEWIAPRPCTDVAFMLGIAHHLETRGNVDISFINRYTVGYDKFKAYLFGHSDGIVKDTSWAASITGVKASAIEKVAERLSNALCPLITVSLSLQRAEHGEQPFWLVNVLAAMLGSLGKKGGGAGYSWASNGRGLYSKAPFSWGKLPQGRNPISQSIPVARIADMLLHPGESYTYNGEWRTYPNINLVYWAGGNPFHHHQDLNRLIKAWRKPGTIIVNDSVWTATARHADIVFPANTFLERNDIVCGIDTYISPSKKVLESYGQSRSDYEIFCGLAERLGVLEAFSEGKDEMDWIKTIYQDSKHNAKQTGIQLPSFDSFWEEGEPINIESQMPKEENRMAQFRHDPNRYPLPTPSGKVEIFSSTIDSFGYSDCTGHAKWLDKDEWLGAPRAKKFPLHMISHQPRNKLHSQLDFADFSRKDKTQGCETVTINPDDARAYDLEDGMLVRIFNDRGACLAGVRISDDIMKGVISLPTGAWYCLGDEEGANPLEYHGNPNVLTPDIGTSSLAQGSSAHSCLVDMEPYYGPTPDIHKLLMPNIIDHTDI